MSALVGGTVRATYMNVNTQSQADALWKNPEPNGFGLPLQTGKTFYGGFANYPTNIGSMEQTFINDGVGMCPVINPTYPFVPAGNGTHPELPQIKAFLNMLLSAGAVIPCVMVGNEVNSGRTYSSAAYLQVVQAIQGVRSVVPLGISFSGYTQDTQAAYWNKNLHDMMQVDYYLGAYSSNKTLATALGLANTANCPFGLGEMGNNNLAVVNGVLPTGFVAYMGYVTGVFQTLANANQPIGQIQWWNGAGPSAFGAPGNAVIASPSDPRLPYLRTLFGVVGTNPVTAGQYDVGSVSTNLAGTTLILTVGTGSIGKPQGTSAGDLVSVLISSTNSSQTIASVIDSKGNSYAAANSYAAGSSQNQWLWVSKTTTALVAGVDTITVTYGLSTGSKSMIVRGSTGVTSATPDKVIVNSGNSIAPSSGTSGTLSHSNELVIGSIADGALAGVPTSPSFGTAETLVQGNNLTIFDQAVNSTNPQTASALLPGSGGNWSAMLTSFQQVGPTVTTPASLGSGVVGTVYLGQETANGGSQPYSWALTTGALPTGLTLNSDGSITGTPSAGGTFTFTVTVTAGGGVTAVSGTQTIIITATGISVTTGSLPSGSVNAVYGPASETVSGGTGTGQTWIVVPGSGTLPNGLALSSAGVISGTATVQGTFTFQVQVTDSGSNVAVSGTQSITINPAGSVSTAISAVAVGVPVSAAHDKAVIAAGLSTAPSATTPVLSQASEFAVSFIADQNVGGVPTWASPWSTHILGNQADGGSNLHLSAAYEQVNATTAITGSGTITSAEWTTGVTTYAISPPASNFVCSDGIVGEPYSQTLESTGGVGAITWTKTGTMPPGVSVPTGGVISGTPTTAGTFNFQLIATDSIGAVVTVPQSVTIAPASTPIATAQSMAGNILSVADSDFETGIGTWVASVNASSLTQSANVFLTGAHSLRWTATADGSTSVITGFYPVRGGQPYILSGYLFGTSQLNPNFWIGVNWYTAGGALISSSSNNGASMLAPLAWQGLQAAFVAPATATQAKVFVTVDAANAGDLNYSDLNFFTQENVQILIDFVNPAFGAASIAGSNFSDVSPWLRMDQGVTYTRGRQDAVSEISTGSGTFNLQNDKGWFTKLNQNSLAIALGGQVTLQERCQINFADEHGAWYTRFDGQVSQIAYTIDPIGNTNLAQISVSDVLAELNRQHTLQNWTKQQVLLNGPLYHWSLDDAPPTTTTSNTTGNVVTTTNASSFYTVAAEGSGNSGPPLKIVRSAQAGAATLAWADGTGGVETLADAFSPAEPDGSVYWPAGALLPTSAIRGLDSGAVGPFSTSLNNLYFTPQLRAGTAKNAFSSNTGFALQALLPALLQPNATPSGDFAVEAWFTIDPSVVTNVTQNYGPYTVFSLGSARRTSEVLVAGVFQPSSGNIPAAGAAIYGGAPAFVLLNFPGGVLPTAITAYKPLPEADTVNRPHHLVVSVQGDPVAPVATVYVDGVSQGTLTLPPGTTFDTITIGGAYGTTGTFFGSISLVSIYPFQLNQSQIIQDCRLGQYGMWEAPTDDCIAQLIAYADLPPFWNTISAQHNGLSLTDYFDITGSNAYNSMLTYEQTEGGLLFVNAAGQLTFDTRDIRMGYGAPKISLPPDSYNADISLTVVDTYQDNEEAVASAAFPGGAAFVNQASQNQFGTYSTNPVGSPAQLAHISYSRAYGQAGLQEQTFWPDPNMLDAAGWPTNSKSDPWLVLGGITVDLLTVDPSWGINISNAYSVEINDVLGLSGTLPASLSNLTQANEFFIEGISETRSTTARTITYYISPASMQRAWIPGDATYGVLGSTTRPGISAADVSTPQADGKDVSHDGGPPYWPPTFSANMNSPAGNPGFVGMSDLRGLVWPLQQLLEPPIAAVAATANTQSLPTGQNDTPQLFWDTLYCDSANGMGIIPGWPNWYVCTVPGFYEIDGQAVAGTAAAGTNGWQAWLVVAENAAQAVVSGIGDPTTVSQYICPVGETVRQNTLGISPVSAPSTRIYLGLGDMVTLAVEQGTGSAQSTNIALTNSALSLRFVGLGTQDDACQINSSLSNGGTVGTPVPITHGTNTYQAQHTFSHYGQGASRGAWTLANKDGFCWQGNPPGGFGVTGPQYTLIRFNWSQIATDLSSKIITSVTLHGHNLTTGFKTGVTLLGGYYYTNNEGASWQPNGQSPGPMKAVWTQQFNPGQSLTFSIPASQFQQMFVQNGAHGVMIGDNATQGQSHYGSWAGGPNSWTLKVSY